MNRYKVITILVVLITAIACIVLERLKPKGIPVRYEYNAEFDNMMPVKKDTVWIEF